MQPARMLHGWMLHGCWRRWGSRSRPQSLGCSAITGKRPGSRGERLSCKPPKLDSEEQVLARAVSAAAVKRVRDTGPEPRAWTSVPVELLFY